MLQLAKRLILHSPCSEMALSRLLRLIRRCTYTGLATLKSDYAPANPLIMPTRPLRWLFFYLLNLFWVGAGVGAWAPVAFGMNTPIVIGPAQQVINVAPRLRFIEDPTGSMRFEDVQALPDEAWTQHHDDALMRGYTRSHFWITFDLRSDAALASPATYVLDMDLSFLGFLDFYVLEGGQVTRHETGLARPYSQRPLSLETFALPLRFTADETKTLFIHAHSEGAMLLPLMLYGEDEFYLQRTNTHTLLGFFISLCLVLSAYNLFLYFTVREPSYLFYTITMLTMLWLQMSLRGFTVYYLWQDTFTEFAYIEPTLTVWLGLIFTLLFTSSFLKLRIWHPRLRLYFMALIAFACLMTAATFIIPVYISLAIFNAASGLSIVSVIWAAIYTLNQGNKAARFFLLGWTFFLISALLTGIYLQGYLPSHMLIRHGMLIGGALEGILLSLALADRINFMQKQKLQAQRDAVATLETAHLLKDEFLLAITRDLYAPLDEIGNTVAKNRDAFSFDELRQHNHQIELGVHEILNSVDNLLCEAELNAGHAVLNSHPFSLLTCLTEVELRFREQCEKKGIEFAILHQAPTGQRLMGDADKIRMVVSHLLKSMLMHTTEELIYLNTRQVIDHEQNVDLLITVAGSDRNVPAEKIDRLLTAVNDTPLPPSLMHPWQDADLKRGTRLIALLGGTLTFFSEPSVGSKFDVHFRLPVAPPVPSVIKPAAGSEPPLALVVEDNLVNQKVLQKMLERCGCRVQMTNHGQEALAFCTTTTPDIVFMDCQMPVMDGFEATRELRKRFDSKQLPIVAVTANALSNDRLRCLEAGMNDYLAKPVKINDINGALLRWLNKESAHAA